MMSIGIVAQDGSLVTDVFLIDSGADRTILSGAVFNKLRWPATVLPSPPRHLSGITGGSSFVLVSTAIELPRRDGPPFRLTSDFAALTDPTATDLSLLGRDVLDQFDVILSRKRNEILLLRPIHQYAVNEE